jgi:hypothetical protein
MCDEIGFVSFFLGGTKGARPTVDYKKLLQRFSKRDDVLQFFEAK